MEIAAILREEGVIVDLKAQTKKQALAQLADKAADIIGVDKAQVVDALLEREKLGSTGLGEGVALPHARLPNLDKIHGIFAALEKPIDFDAVDNLRVDIIFALLVPKEAGTEHLRTLAMVSRLLRDEAVCERLRGCHSAEAAFVILTQERTSSNAA